MLKLLTRSILTLTALLLLFATSSALGARDLHGGTKHAAHNRRAHRSDGGAGADSAVVRQATATDAATLLLGDEAVEPNRDGLGGGQARAFPFQARVSGTAGAVHVYVDSANTATTLLVGLYAQRWHHPGALLSTGSLSAPVPGAWDTVPLASTQLVSGKTYWLAVLGTGGSLSFRDRTHGSCVALTSAQTDLETAATTWRAGTPDGVCPVSAYVTAANPFPVEPPAPVEVAPPPVESTPPVRETPPPPVETTPPPVKTTPPPVETTPPPTETTPPPVETPPPPPVAPSNTALPAISGTPEVGKTLTASSGTWSGSAPIDYAYRWEDCNSSGESCSIISEATASTHILTSSDAGHTLRVLVKATNAGGAGEATSTATSVVSAKDLAPTDCFENPQTEGTERFEACGYPGPKNTGVVETAGKTECSALPEYTGPKTLSTEKSTIEGKDFKITLGDSYGEGGITVDAKEVTLNDDCFLVKGGGNEGPVIHLEGGASKFLLDDSTVRGENDTTQSYEHAINDFGGNRGEGATSGVVLKKDRLEDCGECLSGTFETIESYLIADESFSFSEKISDESLHRETWYANEETVVAKDDTFLVPEWEVAIIFDNTNNGNGGVPCGTHVTVENSLLAGSGQMFQTCGHTTDAGTGTLVLKNNRVARCLTMPTKWEPNETDGCSGSAFAGADSHGYFPYGGSQNIVPSGTPEPWTWEGNYWDDNLKTISKAEAEE